MPRSTEIWSASDHNSKISQSRVDYAATVPLFESVLRPIEFRDWELCELEVFLPGRLEINLNTIVVIHLEMCRVASAPARLMLCQEWAVHEVHSCVGVDCF